MKKFLCSVALVLLGGLAMMADSLATYPGGEDAMKEYIEKNLKYPSIAKENGIEGIISLNVTILPDGSIGAIKVKRMLDPDLEAEAIRLVKAMPAWTPATAGNENVESVVTIHVPFYLQ